MNYGCQQNLISTTEDNNAIIEFICSEANKLTNCGIYYCRQMLFKNHVYVKKKEMTISKRRNGKMQLLVIVTF